MGLILNNEISIKNFRYIFTVLTYNGGPNFITRNLHSEAKYSKYYKALELPDDADQDSVRRAYINLCKRYHPDSGSLAADSYKFQEIDEAYKALQMKFAEERWDVNENLGEYGIYYGESKRRKNEDSEEVKVFDIKHNAPQHRQYLSYDGVGSGTPSQREKQYANHQRMSAIQNVYDHRIKKLSSEIIGEKQALVVKDKKEAKKIQTRFGMERLVEDLIQESMAKGEFDNLKGAGKPLPESNYNPFVDLVTQKMNQVMIDNGFVPEWITLQKEINEESDLIRRVMSEERQKFGTAPLNHREERDWKSFLIKVNEKVRALNKKIDKYNLVVPILDKQMLHFHLEKESDKILERECNLNDRQHDTATNKNDEYDFITLFLGRR